MIQGKLFVSFDFYRQNWAYIIAVTIMMLTYIAQKYETQSNLEKVMMLTEELDNARTDCVNASAKYNSMIRESQMKQFIDTMRINLTAPDQPPYKLSAK
ncbi:MAG: hypothetical protein J6X81_03465 [Muribaculaceae bacterium]|nr:hypothetical protein [Muribaculaceae bacterium]